MRSAIGTQGKSGLLALHGIGYPTATAFLCILNPKAFPVLDRWAVQRVFLPGTRPEKAYGGAAYRAFTQQLVSINKLLGLSTTHDVDQAEMHAAMSGAPPVLPPIALPG